MVNKFIDRIDLLIQLSKKNGIFQGDFVIEECSELIKELIKYKRKGGKNKKEILEESSDVILTITALLRDLGMLNEEKMIEIMIDKIEKHLPGGEKCGE